MRCNVSCVLPVRAKYSTDVSDYNGSEDNTYRVLEQSSVGSKMGQRKSEKDTDSPWSCTFAKKAVLSHTQFLHQIDICP